MQSEIWAPNAHLMESMRAVGYSLPTAIADVIDNSIAAQAGNVEILFSAEERPHIAVLDDGKGMTGATARKAMQLAGMPAGGVRLDDDLGRFGLGLKTASLSQCRRMTVISKIGGEVTGLVWDLDFILETSEWSLIVLERADLETVPYIDRLRALDSGTLVVWENLDKVLELGRPAGRLLDERMSEVREHVSLVFHRFLAGEAPFRKTSIAINFNHIEAADPFLMKSSRTQASREEVIDVDGTAIRVKAFTLPFVGKMSAGERKVAQVAGTLRDSQGFYVYRGGRLVIWGTWFRLMQKSDLGKLSRVRVDIPNSLDHLWGLDIKKSSAVPPSSVRERLRLLAATMLEPSERAHRFRGRKPDDSLIRPWTLIEDRDTFKYQLNRDHPLLTKLGESISSEALRELEIALRTIESTFPSQDLFNRMSRDQTVSQDTYDHAALRQVLYELWRASAGTSQLSAPFVTRMLNVEPFDQLAGDLDELATWLDEEAAKSNGVGP